MGRQKSVYREYAEAIIIAIVLALFIRTFVVQAFRIPSGSMESTLLVGDMILVNKFLYGVRLPFTDIHLFSNDGPERFDVIVFKFPNDQTKDYIKRVIGLPGDTVEVRNKIVFVNDMPFREEHAVYSAPPNANSDFGPIIVPDKSFFVMGDNRDRSSDSRVWGFVNYKHLHGKAFMIYFSKDQEASWLNWIRWSRIGRLIG